MKFFLPLLALVICIRAEATVITVSNTANYIAMFNNLQTAVDAASSGDTIQVYPSVNQYAGVVLNKGLTILGAGISHPIRTNCASISCGTTEPVHLIGLTLYGSIGTLSYAPIPGHDWVIESCNLPWVGLSYGAWTNLLIKNCIDIYHIDGLGDDTGIVFSNNIFRKPNQYGNEIFNEIGGPGAIPVIFEHNIFQGALAVSGANHIFQNNVILDISPSYHTCTNCLFQNNYTTNCTVCSLQNSITGSSVLDNIENGPALFVNYQEMSIDNPNAILANFHLIPGSLAIGAGTGGQDIGIHAGSYPPSDALAYGLRVLGLPVINFFAIDNPIIEQNGQLNIQATTSIPVTE